MLCAPIKIAPRPQRKDHKPHQIYAEASGAAAALASALRFALARALDLRASACSVSAACLARLLALELVDRLHEHALVLVGCSRRTSCYRSAIGVVCELLRRRRYGGDNLRRTRRRGLTACARSRYRLRLRELRAAAASPPRWRVTLDGVATTTGLRITKPSLMSFLMFWREFAMEISFASFGSSQTRFLPVLRTDAARRFCNLSDDMVAPRAVVCDDAVLADDRGRDPRCRLCGSGGGAASITLLKAEPRKIADASVSKSR